jgi:predicted nucleic acid-binding protein
MRAAAAIDFVIVDSSAIVEVLAGDRPPRLVERIEAAELHAPHVLDLEVASALRGIARRGGDGVATATAAFEDYQAMSINRYPHVLLLERIWELRGHLTAYDAAFVALGEALDIPVITADSRLARAGGHGASVEVY